jgi:PAS domain S-box-containing protein
VTDTRTVEDATSAPSGHGTATSGGASAKAGRERRGSRLAGLRNLPVGLKVGLALALAALVFPLVGARWAAGEARVTVQREVLDSQSADITAVLRRLDGAYDIAVRGASSAAERPDLTGAVASGDAAAAVAVLHNVRDLGFYRQVAIYDPTGALLGSDPQGAPSRLADPVPDAPVISAPSTGPNGVVVLVRAAFRSNGVKVGQLVTEISFPSLMGGPDGLRLPASVDVTIVDSEAMILASPLGRQAEGQRILAPEALALIHQGGRGTADYFSPHFGYDVIATFEPVAGRPWSALATSRRGTVFAASDRLEHRLLTGGLLLAGLSLGTALLAGGYVSGAEGRLRRARASEAEQNESLAAQGVELSDAVGRLDVEVAARRQMIDTATDAFVSVDESGVITGWNRQAETTFGWCREDAIGQPLDELLIPPAYREAHRKGMRRFLAGGDGPVLGQTLELSGLRRDGSEFPLELTIWATRIGEQWSFNAFMRDISERVALEVVRARFEAVFQSSGDAVMLVDPDGTVLAWNPAAETIYGYSAEEMVGQNTASVVGVAGQEREREQAMELLANGLPAPAEVRCFRKDGAEIVVAVSRSPILDDEDRLVAVSSISRDITESRRDADALARSNAELARSNADLEDFAAVAAHDLKSPLATIGGFASMLETGVAGELSEDGKTYAGYVVKGVQRMQTLVDDLLAYARVGTEAQSTPVQLAEVVDDARSVLARDIEDTGAVVSAGDLPAVLGDAGQLRQLFTNLIGNAVKFRRAQTAPDIHIIAERAGDRWQLSVSDNGIGIDSKFRERVFKIFQRLHAPEAYPGTGIGLAICRRVVDNHGGRITISDSPGGGTQFRFDLPA